jgi:hypothetical protein
VSTHPFYGAASKGAVIRITPGRSHLSPTPSQDEYSTANLALDLLGYDVMTSAWSNGAPIQRYKVFLEISRSFTRPHYSLFLQNGSLIRYTLESDAVKAVFSQALLDLDVTIKAAHPDVWDLRAEFSGHMQDAGQHGVIGLARAVEVARDRYLGPMA